jgi:predicted ArsR family transcriptional regulator
MSRMQQVIDALQAERDSVKQHLDWLEEQLRAFRSRQPDAPTLPTTGPNRAKRRSTARRASARRSTARSRQGDTKAKIIEYLGSNPGATAGAVAKDLNLNRNSVATRLAQLARSGEIKKAKRGYEAKA